VSVLALALIFAGVFALGYSFRWALEQHPPLPALPPATARAIRRARRANRIEAREIQASRWFRDDEETR
jgi:hypothetical protein